MFEFYDSTIAPFYTLPDATQYLIIVTCLVFSLMLVAFFIAVGIGIGYIFRITQRSILKYKQQIREAL